MKNYYKVTKANGEIEHFLAYASDMYDFAEQKTYENSSIHKLNSQELDKMPDQYFTEL